MRQNHPSVAPGPLIAGLRLEEPLRMFASYHSHSLWSDGENSIAEMVDAAGRVGLAEFGIADHFVLAPDGRAVDWSMPVDRLDDYVAEVQRATKRAEIPLRLGLEVDFFPNIKETLTERLNGHPFDYLIGSVHYVDSFPVDTDASYWQALTQAEVNEVHRLYWRRVAELAESRLFDFVGHLDLPKKFAFLPTTDLDRETAAALDAIAAADLAVELNTSGWDKPCAEGYPSEEILCGCRSRSIPVLINDDCHRPSQIRRHFRRAANLLRRVGYEEVVRFAGRQRSVHPLLD